ncbi:hydroxy-3-methylglutaryl-coenzyme A reductase, partial [mine drainage metagenome]
MGVKKENADKILSGMAAGKIKSYKVGELLGSEEKAAVVRREYLAKKYGVKLHHVSKTITDYEDAKDRNIENMIGSAQVPLSYIEVNIEGEGLTGTSPIYLATTEGKLIAGLTRGAEAINESGCAHTTILKNAMTRSVIIGAESASAAKQISSLCESNETFVLFKNEWSKSTKHGKLLGVSTYVISKLVFIVYSADP